VTIIKNMVLEDVTPCSLVDMYPWQTTRPHIPPDQNINSHASRTSRLTQPNCTWWPQYRTVRCCFIEYGGKIRGVFVVHILSPYRY